VIADVHNLFVSISLPIREPAFPDAPPVGVLEAAIRMEEINHWLLAVKMRNGFAVLVDKRRFCVLHLQDKIRPAMGKPPPKFDFAQLEEQMERDRREGQISGQMVVYRDPVEDGKEYLASYAALEDPEIGWVALVQHDRQAALEPIAQLPQRLGILGHRLLLAAVVLITVLWGWLFWIVRRKKSTDPVRLPTGGIAGIPATISSASLGG
jgi:hypothetical protein